MEPFFQWSLSFNEAFLSIKHFFAHRAVSQFLRCLFLYRNFPLLFVRGKVTYHGGGWFPLLTSLASKATTDVDAHLLTSGAYFHKDGNKTGSFSSISVSRTVITSIGSIKRWVGESISPAGSCFNFSHLPSHIGGHCC